MSLLSEVSNLAKKKLTENSLEMKRRKKAYTHPSRKRDRIKSVRINKAERRLVRLWLTEKSAPLSIVPVHLIALSFLIVFDSITIILRATVLCTTENEKKDKN